MKVNVGKASAERLPPWLIRAIPQPSRSRHFTLPQPLLTFFSSQSSLTPMIIYNHNLFFLPNFWFLSPWLTTAFKTFLFYHGSRWFYFSALIFAVLHVLSPCVGVKNEVRGGVWLKGGECHIWNGVTAIKYRCFLKARLEWRGLGAVLTLRGQIGAVCF